MIQFEQSVPAANIRSLTHFDRRDCSGVPCDFLLTVDIQFAGSEFFTVFITDGNILLKVKFIQIHCDRHRFLFYIGDFSFISRSVCPSDIYLVADMQIPAVFYIDRKKSVQGQEHQRSVFIHDIHDIASGGSVDFHDGAVCRCRKGAADGIIHQAVRFFIKFIDHLLKLRDRGQDGVLINGGNDIPFTDDIPFRYMVFCHADRPGYADILLVGGSHDPPAVQRFADISLRSGLCDHFFLNGDPCRLFHSAAHGLKHNDDHQNHRARSASPDDSAPPFLFAQLCRINHFLFFPRACGIISGIPLHRDISLPAQAQEHDQSEQIGQETEKEDHSRRDPSAAEAGSEIPRVFHGRRGEALGHFSV